MTETDTVILDHLSAIYAELLTIEGMLDRIGSKVDGMAEAAQVACLGRRIDDTTSALAAMFGDTSHQPG